MDVNGAGSSESGNDLDGGIGDCEAGRSSDNELGGKVEE